MKKKFLTTALSKILLAAVCLLLLPHSGICSSDTTKTSKAFSPGIDLNAHAQEIARDLQICDLVKLERNVQAGYIISLKKQVADESILRAKKEKQVASLEVKTKRQGSILKVGGAAILIRIAIKIFLKR